MKTEKHTPTPWHLASEESYIAPHGPEFEIVDHLKNGIWTAHCQSKADAEFIVRAVNSHEANEKKIEALSTALIKIKNVTQFDHSKSQVIGSEEYEGAWLDCVEIAIRSITQNEKRGENEK